MRFLPDIRYGTEIIPKRLRDGFAQSISRHRARCPRRVRLRERVDLEFLDPKPGLWKAGAVFVLAASIWASVPLLHRFGTLWSALNLT